MFVEVSFLILEKCEWLDDVFIVKAIIYSIISHIIDIFLYMYNVGTQQWAGYPKNEKTKIQSNLRKNKKVSINTNIIHTFQLIAIAGPYWWRCIAVGCFHGRRYFGGSQFTLQFRCWWICFWFTIELILIVEIVIVFWIDLMRFVRFNGIIKLLFQHFARY